MLQQDNLSFISRHHKQMFIQTRRPQRDRLLIVLGVCLLILYITLAATLLGHFDLTGEQMFINLILFGVGAMLIIVVHQMILRFGSTAREHRLLREVLEGSRASVFITDPQNHIVYSSQRFDDLIGAKGGLTFADFIAFFGDGGESQAHIQALADQAHRGLQDDLELAVQRAEAMFYYRISAQAVPGWAGHISWRIDDVTEQRELDRAVAEEREKLIDFTDNAPVGFFSVDETGRFVFVNATFARWVGDDIGTLLTTGRLHTYLLDPPSDAAPFDLIDKGGARQLAELRMKGPGGRAWLASINQSVVIDAEGRVRTRAVVYDLTSERAMRQALKASEDRFRRFFEEAPLGIAILNEDGAIVDSNPGLATLLGKSTADIEGKTFSSYVAEADRETVSGALKSLEGQESFETPLEIQLEPERRGPGLQPATVRLYGRRFRDSGNIVLHFIDLTEQKSLEQQFVQGQKMQAIGQLAGGVAHDFNNLLTAIIGFCDLLLLRHKPGDPSFSDIMQIQQNSNRAANLVRQLLAFSRQQMLRPKVQDVTDVLIEVSHLLRRLIGANITLNLVHGHDLGLVRVDALQLEQVLINLAVNARDAMPEGGTLTVTTKALTTDAPWRRGGDEMPAGRWVVIAISDTGTGIPPEIMTRIFEPFFTTKDVGQGTGLGLSTVYGIVRQTGGYLHCHSAMGEGTTFSIYLPVDTEGEAGTEPEPQVAVEEGPSDLTGTAQILLVEDEDAVRTFSSRALANKGYEVLPAESGEAALAVMEERGWPKVDLVVTDVIMPNMDGPTLAKALRVKFPDLKILFMSGYTEERLKEHMDARVYFLPKPFTLKTLAQKVKEVLDD